ncbi:MAG: long-chain fatty acid--CoA ligase [bacterium]
MAEVTRTFDILERYRNHFDKEDVFVYKQEGKWKKFSTTDYINFSNWFSLGLLELGFRKGDKIASISTNQPEWNFIDIGMAQIGVIHVPVFPTIHRKEFEHIISHSEAKYLFISDKLLFQKFEPLAKSISSLAGIYSFNKIEGAKNWMEIIDAGKWKAESGLQRLEEIKRSISPSDVAVLIYTSGTTGWSKGVLLSHRNLVSNFIAAAEVFRLDPEFRYLSILPLCHVGGRLGNYQTQYCGASIYYAENMNALAANMKEVRPEGFDAVPRILEKILTTIISKGQKLSGFKKKLFFWSINLGMRFNDDTNNALWYRMKLSIADRLIFKKWRDAIGGRIKIVGCGGASLQPQVEKIFWAAGVKIINMYGLTETSPIITINRQNHPDVYLGSVGCPIGDVQVKIADDGEILCKGPNIMLEYYKDKDATIHAFDRDGWFMTGDIGYIKDNKFLKVTDRKKEMFKLANGKFIAPQLMENKLKESIYVDHAFIVGEGQKFVGAIISPNFDHLKDWASGNNFYTQDPEKLITLKEINDFYHEIIEALNKELMDYQRIKKILLVHDEWSTNTGELSHTLKLKRKHLYTKYKDLISQIYNQII